jgi:lysozyme family protein
MTTDDLLGAILAREGGFVDSSVDKGGATNYGITATTLGVYRRLNRQATVAEVRAMKPDEARAIYRAQYCAPFECVPFDALKAQLCDFGVNSGVMTAIRTLQKVLGVPMDGVLGDRTRTALAVMPQHIVNDALVGARIGLLSAIVDRDASQQVYLHGWVKRAVSFLSGEPA